MYCGDVATFVRSTQKEAAAAEDDFKRLLMRGCVRSLAVARRGKLAGK